MVVAARNVALVAVVRHEPKPSRGKPSHWDGHDVRKVRLGGMHRYGVRLRSWVVCLHRYRPDRAVCWGVVKSIDIPRTEY